jgi:hypothetical protein
MDERDPKVWEDLGNGLFLRREGVPMTSEEEARFYGRGEMKSFTRRPRPADPRPPEQP